MASLIAAWTGVSFPGSLRGSDPPAASDGQPALRSPEGQCSIQRLTGCGGGPSSNSTGSQVLGILTRCPLSLLAAVLLTTVAWPQSKPEDLAGLSIEDLMNVEVTSVSKREQKMSQVAAAIFVISPEDIRRSGATNIPDLLRMVPGLDVAQINANTWAISARGFNGQFSNKLLVLIDGRSVYTPLTAGVNWDTQNVPLEDIDRIEVIRGPGATVWGANAVNGVINIITKKAGDTLGGLMTGGGGTQEQEFGTTQYGGKIGAATSYRVFTRYFNHNHFPDLTGQDANDNWHMLHGGFRVDGSLSKKDSLTVQGDLYNGSEGATIVHIESISPPDNETISRLASLSGGDILGRWNHIFSSRSDATLQFYFDRYSREGPEAHEARNTFDFDFQHHLALGARQDLIWGAGYRRTSDQTAGTIDLAYVPASQTNQVFSAFVQDEITLKPNHVLLTVGTKLEHNDFSGFEIGPGARVAWTPTDRHTFWAAVSRASRTPSRFENAADSGLTVFPGAGGIPVEVVLRGNPHLKTENVVACELGYRVQPSGRLSIDVAAFFNTYDHLTTGEPSAPYFQADATPHFVLPIVFGNQMHGTTDGVEVAVNWKITDRWTLSPGYALLQMHLHTDATSQDTTRAPDIEGSNPRHQAQFRSHVELHRGVTWDTSVYTVARLPAQPVPSYTRLDTQLRWRVGERLELSLVGQNLLSDHHVESIDTLTGVNSSAVKRGAFAKLVWNY
jgi:iron complex outermembrane receptor protein